jgi:hypothetical protein
MDGADEAAALRRELRSRLGQLGVSLQILAEGLLGEDDRSIDWIALEPSGRVWIVLLDPDGDDEGLLARGLAQRAWVAARLGDWTQLAPGLAARADVRPRVLLLAPSFTRSVRVAAREADAEGIRLARYRWRMGPRGAEFQLEALELPAATPDVEPATPRRVASVFRSKLRDDDFESGEDPS